MAVEKGRIAPETVREAANKLISALTQNGTVLVFGEFGETLPGLADVVDAVVRIYACPNQTAHYAACEALGIAARDIADEMEAEE